MVGAIVGAVELEVIAVLPDFSYSAKPMPVVRMKISEILSAKAANTDDFRINVVLK